MDVYRPFSCFSKHATQYPQNPLKILGFICKEKLAKEIDYIQSPNQDKTLFQAL